MLVDLLVSSGVSALNGCNFVGVSERDGQTVPYGRLYSYSDRPSYGAMAVTYAGRDCTIANVNPVQLDSYGRGSIWLPHETSLTRFVLINSDGATVESQWMRVIEP